MLAQPRVVGRALHGEIERDFEAVRRGGVTQPAEVVERAESGWIASWPPAALPIA